MKCTLKFNRLAITILLVVLFTSCSTTATSSTDLTTTGETVSDTISIASENISSESEISEISADPNSIFEVEKPGVRILRFENLLYEDFNLGKESQQFVTFLSLLQYYKIDVTTPENIWQYVNAIPFDKKIAVEDRSTRFYFGDYKSENVGFSGSYASEDFLKTALKSNGKDLFVETVHVPKYISSVTKYIDEGQPVIYFLDKNLGTPKEGSYDFKYTHVTTQYEYSYERTFVVIVGYDYDCLFYYDSGSPDLQTYKWVSGLETNSWFHVIVPNLTK